MSKRSPDTAIAIAELHSFMSPLFIWQMIWTEIIPRQYNERLDVYRDIYSILTSTHGFSNLLALWYICGKLYQGIAPAKRIIKIQLSLGPGIGKGSFSATPKTTQTILEYMVDEESGNKGVGWFVEKTGRNLAREFGYDETGYKNSIKYIYYSNEIARNNIIAIMKTAIAVGNITGSVEFMENLVSYMTKEGITASEKETHDYLNRMLRVKFANLVRSSLRKYGFWDRDEIKRQNKERAKQSKSAFPENFARLREENEPVLQFRKFDLTQEYPTTMYIPQ